MTHSRAGSNFGESLEIMVLRRSSRFCYHATERKEKMKEGKLLTQAEKEAQKELKTTVDEARKG